MRDMNFEPRWTSRILSACLPACVPPCLPACLLVGKGWESVDVLNSSYEQIDVQNRSFVRCSKAGQTRLISLQTVERPEHSVLWGATDTVYTISHSLRIFHFFFHFQLHTNTNYATSGGFLKGNKHGAFIFMYWKSKLRSVFFLRPGKATNFNFSFAMTGVSKIRILSTATRC